MKHQHEHEVNLNINLPTQDIEGLIDKTTKAALTIIAASTAAHILRSYLAKA